MNTLNTDVLPESERRALPAGTRVQEFEILAHIGGGGFGLVYLAQDRHLERRVALKEYMPPLASRTTGTTEVFVASERDTETFSAGLRSFVNEARLLARFEHSALVKVHRFWEENGTAYMVMPYYEGPTLQRAIDDRSVPTDEDSLRRLLNPLLDAVAALHHEHCFHRDISPDNILVTNAGPVLLDFGAARMAIGEASQDFTVILKEGYAPVEQYAREEATAMRQGPWTDIYALGGVMRFVITGRKPQSAVVRMASLRDPMEPLGRCAAGRYSPAFLRALDMAMEVHVEKRPQSIDEFRRVLSFTADSATIVRPVTAPPVRNPGRQAARPSPVTPPSGTGTTGLGTFGSGVPGGSAGPGGPARPGQATLPLTGSAGPASATLPPPRGPAAGPRAIYHEPHRRSLTPWAIALFLPLALAGGALLYFYGTSHQGLSGLTAGDGRSALSGVPPAVISSESISVSPAVSGSSESYSSRDAPQAAAGSEGSPGSSTGQPAAHEPTPPLPARLNPALNRMLQAARGGDWPAVEKQAAAIVAHAPRVPAGDPKTSRRLNDLGIAAERSHNFAGAVSYFDSAMRADGADIEVQNNYGYALALAGRKAKALEVMNEVLQRDPTREVAWTTLVEARGEDDADALAAIKLALHYAANRERTLRKFQQIALTHPDVHVQSVMKKVLDQKEQVPTVPEGQLGH